MKYLTHRHMRFGWWSLLFFLTMGLALELMHGLKLGWYLDVSNETRRTMWTLSHSHGTLLAVLNIVFALTIRAVPKTNQTRWSAIASPCLAGAGILLPGGFFLGGLVFYAGDPGLGILLVPVGAALLFTAVLATAIGLRNAFLDDEQPS